MKTNCCPNRCNKQIRRHVQVRCVGLQKLEREKHQEASDAKWIVGDNESKRLFLKLQSYSVYRGMH